MSNFDRRLRELFAANSKIPQPGFSEEEMFSYSWEYEEYLQQKLLAAVGIEDTFNRARDAILKSWVVKPDKHSHKERWSSSYTAQAMWGGTRTVYSGGESTIDAIGFLLAQPRPVKEPQHWEHRQGFFAGIIGPGCDDVIGVAFFTYRDNESIWHAYEKLRGKDHSGNQIKSDAVRVTIAPRCSEDDFKELNKYKDEIKAFTDWCNDTLKFTLSNQSLLSHTRKIIENYVLHSIEQYQLAG